ncbi:PRC-barrel domain containing protein [Nitratireductor mangrovi]|uniref:PRC-barrel domain containing protein n=1 Tax=Nitratireductor mangrovi TaxID=2599600 RepID=A0A5B8L2U0_9HYPH|nr:PRC-barrel domain-containing protein [Nitratireductor mangrovi]QDZ02256.1 PRC-barrel domain containing protein [Nitratireductor mangrovi]
MFRKLLATTAIATLVSTGAIAQTTTNPAPADPTVQTQPTAEVPMVVKAEGQLASNIIGASVYNGTGDDAENIGDVNDIVIGPDGNIQAVVIGVGGFLGIGEKHVAIEYDLVEWAEIDGDRWLVVETTADALKAQEEFDRLAYQPMPADANVKETKPASAEDLAKAPAPEQAGDGAGDMAAAEGETAAEENVAESEPATEPAEQDTAMENTEGGKDDRVATADESAQAEDGAADKDTAASPLEDPAKDTDATQTAAIDRSSLEPLATDKITAEEFVGTTVYGANEENIGEIGDVVLTTDGKVDAVIIDVGGFLGIGEKPVAVGLENLEFMTDGEGNRYLYTNFSQEELEAQPAYNEAEYAEKRDDMRMIVPN